MPARKLLLSLRDASFPSTAALLDGISAVVAVPAVFPKSRRAIQIGVCALPPVLCVGGRRRRPRCTRAARTCFPGMASTISLWAVALAVASGMFFLSVVFALPGAFLARGGLTLRAFGAALVNRRGEPASRFRALWRAMVTWSLAGALPIFFKANQKGTSIDTRSLILQSLVMALFIAGAVWTALHPSRSIQDRLAGTWIVPRG